MKKMTKEQCEEFINSLILLPTVAEKIFYFFRAMHSTNATMINKLMTINNTEIKEEYKNFLAEIGKYTNKMGKNQVAKFCHFEFKCCIVLGSKDHVKRVKNEKTEIQKLAQHLETLKIEK